MEQSGTVAVLPMEAEKQRDVPLFSSPSTAGRQRGDSPTHNPPEGGCVVGESNHPMPVHADRDSLAAMVREKLPVCSAIAAGVRDVFGDVRMVFASENGHELGQRSPDGVKASESWMPGVASKPERKR